MVIGKWVHKGGAVLILRRDGTFTGMNLPSLFGEVAEPTPSFGTGSWHVGRIGDAPRGVVLDFSGLRPPITDELLVENCCDLPITIFYDLGDPDGGLNQQYQLAKQQTTG
jgi:hypothetical protein